MDNDPLSNGFFGKVNKHMAYIYIIKLHGVYNG